MQNLINEINQKVEVYVGSLTEVKGSDLGLDERVGRLYTDGFEGIVVHREADRRLCYYGGFEYVDVYYRQELGDYVFYMQGEDRVDDCLDHFRRLETV
jgi:hypothetical protein